MDIDPKKNAIVFKAKEILSEWEPGEEDAAFLAKTLPNDHVSFYFKRPATDGWEQAFADAARSLDASAAEESHKLSYKRFEEIRERRKMARRCCFPCYAAPRRATFMPRSLSIATSSPDWPCFWLTPVLPPRATGTRLRAESWCGQVGGSG